MATNSRQRFSCLILVALHWHKLSFGAFFGRFVDPPLHLRVPASPSPWSLGHPPLGALSRVQILLARALTHLTVIATASWPETMGQGTGGTPRHRLTGTLRSRGVTALKAGRTRHAAPMLPVNTPSTLLSPTSVSAPPWPVVARLRAIIIARLRSVVIALLVIGAIKVCMPRGGAVAGAAVARTVIDTLTTIVRLTVIGTLVAIVRLRLLIPLVEVVKQKRERKRNAPADLSLSWTLGGKEQTACCEQNNERFHASNIMSRVTTRKGK
jgi:hypothetical protein